MKRIILITLSLFMMTGLFGCNNTSANPSSSTEPSNNSSGNADIFGLDSIKPLSMTEDEFPAMDGSTATIPLAKMLYRITTDGDEFNASNAVEFTKTTNSYVRLMDREVDLVIAYEAGEAAKNDPRFSELLIEPVGLDALVFLCNEGNPVKSLSTEQIQGIYSGWYTNWSEVGGDNKDIMAFQRPENSGSQTLMENLMMKDISMTDAPKEMRPSDMGDLIERVASYNNEENALGYSVYYYARNMYSIDGIRFMQVDGVAPDNDTIMNGEYGYVNPFYVAIRKDSPADSPEYKIFEWLKGIDGQSLVSATGYVSMLPANKSLPGKYDMPEASGFTTDVQLVVNNNDFEGATGIIAFDKNMQPIKRYTDIVIAETALPAYGGIIAADLIKDDSDNDDPYARSIGLFDVNSGKWIAKPLYHNIYYVFNDKGEFTYRLIKFSDYPNWDRPGKLSIYDMYGNLLSDTEYPTADDAYDAAMEGYEYDDRMVYSDDKYETLLGGDSKLVQIYNEDDTVAELVVGGEVIFRSEHGNALPYQVDMHPLEIKKGWSLVSMNTYDDDLQKITENASFILDENGNIKYSHKGGANDYISLVQGDYFLLRVYEESRNLIMDYDGNVLYSWQYSEGIEY